MTEYLRWDFQFGSGGFPVETRKLGPLPSTRGERRGITNLRSCLIPTSWREKDRERESEGRKMFLAEQVVRSLQRVKDDPHW